MAFQQISVTELDAWLRDPQRSKPVLLDVREPWEYETVHLDSAVLMPMATVPGRLGELDPGAEIVAICHHGMRSYHVAEFLAQQGFRRVFNLTGGMDEWAHTVDPGMTKY